MRKYVERFLTQLLLAPALLPLVYISGFLYPYVAPKTFLFRGFGVMVLASLVFLALSRSSLYWERLKQKATWIPAALLFVAYATSLIGIDFYHSFWSIYDRGDGLLTLTAACIFFYGIILSADKHFLMRLCKVSAWVASFVALYAILQWIQSVTGMNIPLVENPRGRIGATFGNAAFLAAYLGMTFFATLAVAGEYFGRWRRIVYIGAALQFLAIVFTATRGTFLALIIVGFCTLVYLAWKGDPPNVLGAGGRIRTRARAVLIGGLVLAALFFGFREQLKQTSFEPVRRIASISLTDPTVSSRIFLWNNAFFAGLEKPLTGYGAEHVSVLFNRFYDPTLILEQWFDRTHNAFLDYFVQYGIFGALLYACVIGALGRVGFKLFRSGDRYGAALLLLVGVYSIQNFFVFDTAITLWLLLAFLAAALVYESPAVSESRFRFPKAAAPAVGGAILVLLYPVSIEPALANLYLANGYRDHVENVRHANILFERGHSLNTYADIEYGYQAYEMYTSHQVVMLAGEERVFAYRFALKTLTSNFNRYPYDARTAMYLAHVLDLTPPEVERDEAFEREVINRATELSPKRLQSWFILANISLRKGDKAGNVSEKSRWYKEAIGIIEEYVRLVPASAEPRYVLANVYLSLGDVAMAKKWASEGLPLYTHLDVEAARRAFRYYIAMEDWPNAERFMKDILGEEPDNYPLLYDFAKVRFLQGAREEALAIVARLRTVAPELVASDPAFLQAIGQ